MLSINEFKELKGIKDLPLSDFQALIKKYRPDYDISKIRNFCIIAHIDHGKSTLADRLLEITNTIPKSEMREQFLDQMDLEREKGITIKSHPVRMIYNRGDERYILNLIDTPGHVDFTYEVSRALAAAEGALLVVDATQGVQAQTIANYNLALDANLELIPVINKIDLPNANPESVALEIEETLLLDEPIFVSAKYGTNVDKVLEAIIHRLPQPKGDPKKPLKALIFDAFYNSYRGVIVFVRVFDGFVYPGQRIKLWSSNKVFEVEEVGFFTPKLTPAKMLLAGEVGYIIAGIKDIEETRIGDTITDADNPTDKPLPGYREPKPMVFSSFFPSNPEDYEKLIDAISKLKLNDAALQWSKENSQSLGFGIRCGFLGLLHLQIVQERLEREFQLDIISTTPSVKYRVTLKDGTVLEVDNPAKWPDEGSIAKVEEPVVNASIVTPVEYLNEVLKLIQSKRGTVTHMENMGNNIVIKARVPLMEMIVDFYDLLKSVTRGYASLDYTLGGYQEADMIKLNILIHGKPVDALSLIVHRDKAYWIGRNLVNKLKEVIPRQLFEFKIQAAIGRKVIASVTVKPLRKNVLAKCYGGDVTRKKKLLERQKEGKKRLKQVGQVAIPQEAFWSVLSVRTSDKRET